MLCRWHVLLNLLTCELFNYISRNSCVWDVFILLLTELYDMLDWDMNLRDGKLKRKYCKAVESLNYSMYLVIIIN